MARSRLALFGFALFVASVLWWARPFLLSTVASASARWSLHGGDADGRWAFVKRPKYFFVFGDSYSSEGLDWKTATHPLDPHPILTNSDGPIWARYLARRWAPDTTLINLSVDGATVDKTHIRDPLGREDLVFQVAQFARFFGANATDADRERVRWSAGDAVASLAFGTNDVALSAPWMSELLLIETYVSVAHSYLQALTTLHAAGVRAFVFSEVLPLDQAALAEGQRAKMKGAVRAFNDIVLRRAVRGWCKSKEREGTVCVWLETYELAERVMSHPEKYGFRHAHDWCPVYAMRRNAEPDLDESPECDGPLRDYVWRDAAHPSYAFHELWADLYADAAEKALKALR